MTEEILSYIWQFQKFNLKGLRTEDGSELAIINPGFLNGHSGPDFSEAKIRIGSIQWHGNVELHVNSSDWEKHGHGNDSAYKNVILHVVWIHDKEIFLDKYQLPVLELKGKVSFSLLNKAQSLIKNLVDIPCSSHVNNWGSVHVKSAIEGASISRLERKSAEVNRELSHVNGNWEEVFFRMFSAHLGLRVNKEPFYRLATEISHRVVLKCAASQKSIEAILMGVGGHLNQKVKDPYFKDLQKEYQYLKQKFNLSEIINPGWKFLRMRPANFPTVRIAQLAAVYAHSPNIFRMIIEAPDIGAIRTILKREPSPYWKNHYLFGKTAKIGTTKLGDQTIDLLIINTVAPILFSYGKLQGISSFEDKGINLLQDLPPEKNRITRRWEQLGMKLSSSLESQGSIELFQGSCLNKKCLQCKIGIHCLSEANV